MTRIDPARAQELAAAALRHHRALPHMLQREGHTTADALDSGDLVIMTGERAKALEKTARMARSYSCFYSGQTRIPGTAMCAENEPNYRHALCRTIEELDELLARLDAAERAP